jgi:glutamate formiminotransferase/formiminotetrahydrofolate cyclodeaminase
MKKLVECVPNFSEGRDRAVIDALADAVRKTPGCTLLDVDPGQSTNRTVYTFVGEPEAVVEGAFHAARVARDLIDMRRHHGEHPRIGAMDVCPFVPVSGVTMDECVACAVELGRRLGEELRVPVYLYGAAARHDHRRTLLQIRSGEYEGLAARIVTPDWVPDFGPAEFVPSWGATAVGGRDFLIAYNVNVLGTKEQAHRIALDLREQGRGPGRPGRLKAVRGIGWWVEEYALAQVSMNLEDYTVTPPHVAFEACVEAARGLNLAVAGSEIVGLVPLQALLLAAEHYVATEDLFVLDERQRIRLVTDRLGLSSVARFEPEKRIVEYLIADEAEEPLARGSLRGFVSSLGSRSPAPGGGSAAAAIAAMGAALGAMVGWMTYGKRRFEEKDAVMRRLIPPLHRAMQDLVPLVDADTRAFNAYREAASLPADDPEKAVRRRRAMQEALWTAVEVPLSTMRLGDSCWDALVEMARHGNVASRSDLEVGAKALETGIWGAWRNVLINLAEVEDADRRGRTEEESRRTVERAKEKLQEVLAILEQR